ncbi:glycine zipper 2TM domain-containing protein [uncultured Sphingomonas sp.]|uniref:glycine zipper 2TM domain-containing protein n=1 Tax=uncultured Sphingomonas sp. TaxID=158754 RepID=UPI0025EE866C|nr:glycine zipper 2TM domain-containing protein [uncultured Sphingomonas sp.]
MLKTLSIAAGTLAMAVTSFAPVAAQAQGYYRGYDDRGYSRAENDDRYRDHERAYADADRDGWNQGPQYYETDRPRRYRPRTYRDARDYRYTDRGCQNGTTGTIVGAIAGGLLGRVIDRRGDRTLGTVLGAGGGALAGNAVERSNNPAYCRR